MIFTPELAAKVMDGSKTVTRRLPSDKPLSPWWRECCTLQVGRTYAVQPGRGKPAIGRVLVEAVTYGRLRRLSEDEARREGFKTTAHFEAAWVQINGTYDPNAWVWRVEFRLQGSEA